MGCFSKVGLPRAFTTLLISLPFTSLQLWSYSMSVRQTHALGSVDTLKSRSKLFDVREPRLLLRMVNLPTPGFYHEPSGLKPGNQRVKQIFSPKPTSGGRLSKKPRPHESLNLFRCHLGPLLALGTQNASRKIGAPMHLVVIK